MFDNCLSNLRDPLLRDVLVSTTVSRMASCFVDVVPQLRELCGLIRILVHKLTTKIDNVEVVILSLKWGRDHHFTVSIANDANKLN